MFHPLKLKAPVLWVIAKIFISILVLTKLALIVHQPLIIGPFAASCGLLFSVPYAIPAKNIRHMMVGHLLAVSVGLAVSYAMGLTVWSVAIAGALTVLLMVWTNSIHPPACATAVAAVIEHATGFFMLKVGAAVLALVVLYFIFNFVGTFIPGACTENAES